MKERRAIGSRTWQSLLMAAVWLVLGMASAHAGNTVTKVTYVYTNAQGTPLAKADAQGNIIARYTYRPYGVQQSGPTNNKGPGYTGHVNDPDTGLVYMQQRYYDPDSRFISPDPIRPTPGNIYNFNRYAYANNNPVRYIDPTGACVGAPEGSDHNAPDPVCPPSSQRPVCNARCKQERQQAEENQRVLDFGGSVVIFDPNSRAQQWRQTPAATRALTYICGAGAGCAQATDIREYLEGKIDGKKILYRAKVRAVGAGVAAGADAIVVLGVEFTPIAAPLIKEYAPRALFRVCVVLSYCTGNGPADYVPDMERIERAATRGQDMREAIGKKIIDSARP